jgi:hypothetical protein
MLLVLLVLELLVADVAIDLGIIYPIVRVDISVILRVRIGDIFKNIPAELLFLLLLLELMLLLVTVIVLEISLIILLFVIIEVLLVFVVFLLLTILFN